MIRKFTIALIAALSLASTANADVLVQAQAAVADAIIKRNGLTSDGSTIRVDFLRARGDLVSINGQEISVMKLDFNINTGAFYATLNVDNKLYVTTNGRYYEIVKVPVLRRKIAKGTAISENDISIIEFQKSKIKESTITKSEELIGKTLAKMAYANRPVRYDQLAQAIAVKQEGLINISFRNNKLFLQDQAVALENGTIGQIIRVKNLSSNKVLRARVISESEAEVLNLHNNYASIKSGAI